LLLVIVKLEANIIAKSLPAKYLQKYFTFFLNFFSNQPPILQKGIIVLGIYYHELALMIFQVHPVTHLFEMFSSQSVLNTEGIQAKPLLVPPCSAMLKYVSNHCQIPLINLYPRIFVSINLLSVEQPFISSESVLRKFILPAEIRNSKQVHPFGLGLQK